MNLERAAMMGKQAEAKQRQTRLTLKIEGDASHIRQCLNTTLTPPAELEIPLLDEQWDELKTAWAELQVVTSYLARLEKELR